MIKNMILKAILAMLDGYAASAAATPDPFDDMITQMLRSFVEKLMKANSHADLKRIGTEVNDDFKAAFPQDPVTHRSKAI